MATIYQYQSANVRRTWIMFAVFFAVFIALGWVISAAYGDYSFLLFAIIFSVVYSLISYHFSASIALALARATPLTKQDNPMLYTLVENLTITDGTDR